MNQWFYIYLSLYNSNLLPINLIYKSISTTFVVEIASTFSYS